jgi:hypothetical protein
MQEEKKREAKASLSFFGGLPAVCRVLTANATCYLLPAFASCRLQDADSPRQTAGDAIFYGNRT